MACEKEIFTRKHLYGAFSPVYMEEYMEKLEEKLEYKFRDRTLLHTALTHSSYANERKKSGVLCNERLEFLGDSVLGMITAEYLFRNEPEMPEGVMTRLRSELVCERSLAEVGRELGLGELMYLGRGEENGGGRTRPSIIADAVEAVLAAVYLDGGIEPVRKIVDKFIFSRAELIYEQTRDYKTELQEILQRDGAQDITYKMVGEDGPDHCKTFTSGVYLNGKEIGRGSGRSKKEAEQSAAKSALGEMKK